MTLFIPEIHCRDCHYGSIFCMRCKVLYNDKWLCPKCKDNWIVHVNGEVDLMIACDKDKSISRHNKAMYCGGFTTRMNNSNL